MLDIYFYCYELNHNENISYATVRRSKNVTGKFKLSMNEISHSF